MLFNNLELNIPRINTKIKPGYKIKLGRFESTVWVVLHDWYSWGGNRPVCGWFLRDISNPCNIKPLQLNDLDDVYIVQM